MNDLINLNKPIKILPNLRFEDKGAKSGYIWGKPVKDSNILKMMKIIGKKNKTITLNEKELNKLGIKITDIIAERWIISDDREYPSMVEISKTKKITFYSLLEKHGESILGKKHFKKFGPYLSSIMKIIDTNKNPHKGSLSIQVHPKKGHPALPSKPEMWKGKGKVYLGWNCDITEKIIRKSIENNTVEKHLNSLDMNGSLCVLISGGIVHAIRYDSFLFEWSYASSKNDCKKGALKQSTVALSDRTDGKNPRPGKEDVDSAIDIIKHANTFLKTKDYVSTSKKIFNDKKGNYKQILFSTMEVIVEEIQITSSIELLTKIRGFPIFLEKGTINVIKGNKIIDIIYSGEERFFPSTIGEFHLHSIGDSPALLQKWYAPVGSEY